MPAHDRLFATIKRVPLAVIDAAVCARLGPARARHVGGRSTTSIGKFYNGRDHSTVCHSVRRIESMRDDNAELDQLLSGLCHELREQAREIHRKVDSPGSRNDWADDGFVDMLVDRIVDRIGGAS